MKAHYIIGLVALMVSTGLSINSFAANKATATCGVEASSGCACSEPSSGFYDCNCQLNDTATIVNDPSAGRSIYDNNTLVIQTALGCTTYTQFKLSCWVNNNAGTWVSSKNNTVYTCSR